MHVRLSCNNVLLVAIVEGDYARFPTCRLPNDIGGERLSAETAEPRECGSVGGVVIWCRGSTGAEAAAEVSGGKRSNAFQQASPE